jgi:GrpB-like predicted nucleotidyltransferase (UPF0157 family)
MTLSELWQLFPIIIEPYNPQWRQWYADMRAELTRILDGISCRISHIGSTAVEGLCAKPTVDILLEINDFIPYAAELKKRLSAGGWLLMSETDTPSSRRLSFNHGYTERGFAERVFHLHAVPYGCNDELYFRDFLRENKAAADEYGRLKLRLKDRYTHDRDAYTDAKAAFVKKYTDRARRLYGNRYE